MLAMHYAIPLAGPGMLDTIRERAATRGPLFDRMQGLADKLFLLDTVDPCYATFYLWRDSEAALRFLTGPFFAALSSTFGRPEVHLWLTEAQSLPAGSWERAVLTPPGNATPTTDSIEVLDPRSGTSRWLARPPAAGRGFEVMYHAQG